MQAVGASAVALDPGEVYVALQNKTVDCILFLANLTLSSKVYEVAPYVTFWRDGANASMYYLNMAQWNRVSPADQQVMLQVRFAEVAAKARTSSRTSRKRRSGSWKRAAPRSTGQPTRKFPK
jgi:TRAP-type C4-dicarboxylate transport system substrate-binding protein